MRGIGERQVSHELAKLGFFVRIGGSAPFKVINMYTESYAEKIGREAPAEEKLEALERVLKAVLRVEDIRYGKYPHTGKNINEVILVDADPETVKIRGYEGELELWFDSEIYIDEHGMKWAKEIDTEVSTDVRDYERSRITATFFMHTDPWVENEKLREEIKELKKNAD